MQQRPSTEPRVRFLELLRAVERSKRMEAVARFRQLRAEWQGATMTRDEILAARHEGHRPPLT